LQNYLTECGYADMHGNILTEQVFKEMLDSFKIKDIAMTVKNVKANFVECIHQMLGNMFRMHNLSNLNFDEKEPWADIISQCAWTIHTTVHTTLDARCGQLVFGRDMLFDFDKGDSVFLNGGIIQCKMNPKHDGLYTVDKVYTNGVIKANEGIVA